MDRSGLAEQGGRFVLAGICVALVYVLTTTILAFGGLRFQAALAIGFCLGVTTHFTLQHRFVWVRQGGYALPLRQQASRYLIAASAQYGLTALGTSMLPAMLGLPVEFVYLGSVVVLASMNFVLFRHVIFHGVAKTGDQVSG